MKVDLVICHRVCPALAKVAIGYASKREMVAVTAQSMADALANICYRLVVVLDGCPDYEEIFRRYFDADRLLFVHSQSIGNQATWAKQIEILSKMYDVKYVYFSEDDYLYRSDAFRVMMDFMCQNDVDFVTPLDHPDRYAQNILESSRVAIRVSSYCHWRETGTSCLTFMMRAAEMKNVRWAFDAYTKGNLDSVMWLGLTRDRLWDVPHLIWNLVRFLLGSRHDVGQIIQLSVWKQFGLPLLWRRRFRLWSPIPTLAVHLARVSLPPGASRFFSNTSQRDAIEQAEREYLMKAKR